MTNEAKCRQQLYLDKDISEKLQALAAKPGASKSAILADAVQAWLTKRGTQKFDDRFALRLERISTQLARIERDQQVMMESQALFIRGDGQGRKLPFRYSGWTGPWAAHDGG